MSDSAFPQDQQEARPTQAEQNFMLFLTVADIHYIEVGLGHLPKEIREPIFEKISRQIAADVSGFPRGGIHAKRPA